MIFAQAAKNVFDINDGIIDDFADGDGESAEGECVERDAEAIEDHDRGEQRQRNGDERNDGYAKAAEEDEENKGNEEGAEVKRVFDVSERNFDERGGSMNGGSHVNAGARQ